MGATGEKMKKSPRFA